MSEVKDASDAERSSPIQTDDINKKSFPSSNATTIDAKLGPSSPGKEQNKPAPVVSWFADYDYFIPGREKEPSTSEDWGNMRLTWAMLDLRKTGPWILETLSFPR